MKNMKRINVNLSLTLASFISITIGTVMVAINFVLFMKNVKIFTIINFFAIIAALGIPLAVKYIETNRRREVEKYFPIFLRDVADAIATGMTLPQAFRSVQQNDYGILTSYVREMAAKMDWGISFEKILSDFTKKVGSPTIKRSVKAIIETHRSGGEITTILTAVAETQGIVEKIKRERASSVYAQMVNGYMIFFVFLGIMIGLSKFLIPSFHWEGFETGMAETYNQIFRDLVLIQGVFAGLAIGKMAEGSIISGVKHSLVLATVGFMTFMLLI